MERDLRSDDMDSIGDHNELLQDDNGGTTLLPRGSMPFHLQPEFLTIPYCWRVAFLRRNQLVQQFVSFVRKARVIGEAAWRRRGYDSHCWQRIEDSFVFRRARVAASLLRRRFGIVLGGRHFQEVVEIAHGGRVFEEYKDPWTDPYRYLMPYAPVPQKQFIDEWERSLDKLCESDEELREARRKSVQLDSLNSKQCRRIFSALTQLRNRLGIRGFNQQQDSYYARLLNFWDVYTGWTGQGYVAPPTTGVERVTLIRAAKKAGCVRRRSKKSSLRAGKSTVEVKGFYKLYRWIVGEKFSLDSWIAHFGHTHENWYERRAAGRRPGQQKRVRTQALPTDRRGQEVIAGCADDDLDVRFLDLVRTGLSWEKAAAELDIRLSPAAVEYFRAHRDILEDRLRENRG